jgi:hypothetical protein
VIGGLQVHHREIGLQLRRAFFNLAGRERRGSGSRSPSTSATGPARRTSSLPLTARSGRPSAEPSPAGTTPWHAVRS